MFFDGGMGSLLQERGLATGELPETWNLIHPDIITDIHRSYIEAGADLILANTFGANRYKYDNLDEIITAGIQNVREAIRQAGPGYEHVQVVLDIGSAGKLLKPLGTTEFEEAVSVFGEIARIGAKAGADIVLIETMNDLYEMKAAVLGVKENCELPIFATAAFSENGKMMTGGGPRELVALLEGLGVSALGINCSLGPKQMKPIFEEIAHYASIPLIINPNAGIPRAENGKTVYDVSAEEFSDDMMDFAKMGAWYIGGCCGTTPEYIRQTVDKCKDIVRKPLCEKDFTIVSSGMNSVLLGDKPVIIGERINPTGKSRFKQALRDNNIEYILGEGDKQVSSGAHILDVNVGLPEIDEVAMMKKVVYELQSVFPLPLQIDTTSAEAMEQALRLYNGKAMVNSVNGKAEVMEAIFPIVKKYGGVVVGLTIDEDGIPSTIEGRLAIADKIYLTAEKYGIKRKDIVIDALTMTMSTDSTSAAITLGTVKAIKARGGRTVLGVSNISFGLPQREIINSTFYTMAMQAGLSAGIINPNSKAMMQAYDSFCVLGSYDDQCMDYIGKYTPSDDAPAAPQAKAPEGAPSLKDSIIKGMKENAYKATANELLTREPLDIINEDLVGALNIVGDGFEKGKIFLPQLLMSAEAAKAGFEAIREHMEKSGASSEKKYTIVIATVKGDIHDIGKNIVKVLLENYSYDVIDLGKDVPPEVIVDKVVETHATLCGLSALMTTTVVSMEDTIKLLREKAPWCKVCVGGAVLTQEYADMIGADFYGKDAMQTVYYAESLLDLKRQQ